MTRTVGSEPSSVECRLGGLGESDLLGRHERSEPRQTELAERPQRTWGAQGVAVPAQHAQAVDVPDCRRDGGGLAGAAVAGERVAHAGATADLPQSLTQDVELTLALQQAHGAIVVHRRCLRHHLEPRLPVDEVLAGVGEIGDALQLDAVRHEHDGAAVHGPTGPQGVRQEWAGPEGRRSPKSSTVSEVTSSSSWSTPLGSRRSTGTLPVLVNVMST